MLKKLFSAAALTFTLSLMAHAENELRVPGFTAYHDMLPDREEPVDGTGEAGSPLKISWFGDIKSAGELDCAVALHLSANTVARLRLIVAGKSLGWIPVKGTKLTRHEYPTQLWAGLIKTSPNWNRVVRPLSSRIFHWANLSSPVPSTPTIYFSVAMD